MNRDGEISIKGRSYVEDEEMEDITKEKEDRDIELLEYYTLILLHHY